ncbi:rhamnosyltransferase [Mobilisporobacter senegalensis]|uniref:Rhamnosyltransferase n=1 Tax=Mobilisporobacter senegalensis TaxID=1329262 RepID=A0A3N1XLH8_9FIRM|nr:glycosyltransferase [Mobilisporobacter senegalensis]ROR27535.1 rhamnosyltransferase [Mobilisporobacter senegalensis]
MVQEEVLSKKKYSLDLIIPSYKPDNKFYQLMRRLEKQTIKPDHIFVINTEEEFLDISRIENISNLKVIHIKKEEFDHGGTRNFGATLSNADIILFMTQDAVPADKYLIERMLEPFDNKNVAVAYGRQLANKEAGFIEQYIRTFNYPENDSIKSVKDLDTLGIKTYFCSNVCAAYKREIYNDLGGFVTKTIFNEDMIMASKVIGAGYSIGYAANAKVIHSHKYSYFQQFTRNFDLAVSQRQYKEIFENIKSETEGIRMVKSTAKYLLHKKKIHLIPDLVLQSGFKYLGFKMGYHYEKLPKWLILKFSMNKSFWKNY